MKKVYQTIIDSGKGNCMQAAIASLFDEELNNVPNFILSKNGYYLELFDFLKNKGYKIGTTLYNEKFENIINPTQDCFENIIFLNYNV